MAMGGAMDLPTEGEGGLARALESSRATVAAREASSYNARGRRPLRSNVGLVIRWYPLASLPASAWTARRFREGGDL